MLNRGVYLPPSPLEAIFVSAAHTEEDLRETLQAAAVAFETLKAGGRTGR